MSHLHSVCNQPPMLTQDSYYSSWRKDFEAYICTNDPDMWIPLVERYERPVIEGTKTEKSYISMTTTERKACENERKALTAIQSALSMEVLKLFKHHKNAYDLWVAIEKRCGGYQMEEEHQNSVLVAQVKEVDSDSLKCLSCIQLTGSNSMYRDDIENLRSNLENLTQANKVLKSNERLFENKLKAVQTDTSGFKAKIFSQQDAIDSYLKEITLLKRELAESQAELTDLKRKYGNWTSSSIIFDDLLKVQRMLNRKTGIGFNQCPPPTDFCPLPVKDAIKDFVPSFSKVDTNSVNAPVNEQVKKAELVRPTSVKPENKPPVSVEEVVEVEDILEGSTIKVEKLNVKPENFIITTENDERFKCKGKTKVDNKSKSLDNSQSPVKNLKKNKLVEKYENNKCTTSTSSTSGTPTSTCSPKSACSTNVPANRPSVYCPPPKRFEGTHWNRSYVERRSCFRCGQQGHIIRDCKLLSLDRFGRGMPRTSSFRNSFSKSFSRRGSYSPVSSCASNSPKPTVRVNKVVPIRPQVQRHNIVENKSSEPKQVWRPKSTNDTSMKSSEFLKYHKLIDVMVMDDRGQPKSIKAWVSHKY